MICKTLATDDPNIIVKRYFLCNSVNHYRFVNLDDEKNEKSSKCGDCKTGISDGKTGNDVIKSSSDDEKSPTSPKRRRSVPLSDIIEMPEETEENNNNNNNNNSKACKSGG